MSPPPKDPERRESAEQRDDGEPKKPRNYKQFQEQLDELVSLYDEAETDYETKAVDQGVIQFCNENRDIVDRPHPKRPERRAILNAHYTSVLLSRVERKIRKTPRSDWEFNPYYVRTDKARREIGNDLYQASQAALMLSIDMDALPRDREGFPNSTVANYLIRNAEEAYQAFKEYEENIDASQARLTEKMEGFLTEQFGAGNFEIEFYTPRTGEIMVAPDGEMPQTANFQTEYFRNGRDIGAANFDLWGQSKDFPFTDREFIDGVDW